MIVTFDCWPVKCWNFTEYEIGMSMYWKELCGTEAKMNNDKSGEKKRGKDEESLITEEA